MPAAPVDAGGLLITFAEPSGCPVPSQRGPWFVLVGGRYSPLTRAEEDNLAVSYFVFPLVAARGQAVMQALIRSAVPLTGIPPPDALFSRLHFSVQAGSF